ncbi:MAG: hypothetical protein MJZ34_08000 [Paludibacteraceae bacterium]|nr:hypothetical protein [Paludibacteraceae bacterium]
MKHIDIETIIHKHNLELIDWDEAEYWYGTDNNRCIVYTCGLGSNYWKDDGEHEVGILKENVNYDFRKVFEWPKYFEPDSEFFKLFKQIKTIEELDEHLTKLGF